MLKLFVFSGSPVLQLFYYGVYALETLKIITDVPRISKKTVFYYRVTNGPYNNSWFTSPTYYNRKILKAYVTPATDDATNIYLCNRKLITTVFTKLFSIKYINILWLKRDMPHVCRLWLTQIMTNAKALLY